MIIPIFVGIVGPKTIAVLLPAATSKKVMLQKLRTTGKQ